MRRASVPLIGLIALFSLAACGSAQCPPRPPVILSLPDCPAPKRPALPRIDGDIPLDAPANVSAMLARDDSLRLHVKALDATLDCFNKTRTTGE